RDLRGCRKALAGASRPQGDARGGKTRRRPRSGVPQAAKRSLGRSCPAELDPGRLPLALRNAGVDPAYPLNASGPVGGAAVVSSSSAMACSLEFAETLR